MITSMNTESLSSEYACYDELSAIDSNREFNSITNQNHPTTMNDYTNNSIVPSPTKANYISTISSSIKITCMLGVFTGVMMMIGILIVYYTSPKPPGKMCTFILKSEAHNSISGDSHPHSIAVGDFNNDGLPDIVVPNSGTNNIGIFLRHDNNSFTDQMTYSTGVGSTPYAVAVGDFNKDKRLDVVVANFGTNNIGIFLGVGNGIFTVQRNFFTGSSRPRWIIVGDFNNDTQLDVAVVNYGTNNIGILLGDGNGNFANQMTFPTGFHSIPYSLAVADLNNDGKLDVAVANYGTNNIGVFFGHGNGSLGMQNIFNTGIDSRPYSISISDLNNDTRMDIVVTCFGLNTIDVLLNIGNGSFKTSKKYSTGNNSSPISVTIGDFDNDNKLDIAVINRGIANVGVLFGYGNGSFADQMTFFTSSGSNPYAIATGDFNRDNRLDLAIVNYDFNYVEIILTYRDYSFANQIIYRTTGLASSPWSLALGDFNNDSRLDIIVTNYMTNSLGVFLGYNDGMFLSQVMYSTGSNSGPYSVTIGDFNNDNRLDVAVANFLGNNLCIFLGYGDGTFTSPTTYSTGSSSGKHFVAVGDFNNDTQLDIVVANYWDCNIGIFFGYGDGNFASQITYSTGSYSYPSAVAVGDLNNDKLLDIIVANYWTNNVGVFLGIGNGSFSAQKTYSTGYGSQPTWITVADLNNDSFLDIIVVNNRINSVGVLFGYNDGTFLQLTNLLTGNNSWPQSVNIADFNNDRQLDIVVTNYQTDTLGIFLNYGNGSFSTQITCSLDSGSNPGSVAAGDVNHDGQPDLVVANYGASNVGVLIGYGNGSFKSVKTYSTRGDSNPQSVAVGDFNYDNRPDIVVANYWSHTIDIFFSYGDGTFSSQISYSTGSNSHPYSVAVGNFNNDTRLDIVVANSWSNTIGVFLAYNNDTFTSQTTYSTGSYSQPYAIAVGDFNNDTRLDIVVANSGTNNIGIFLGNGDGTFSSQTTFSTGSGSGPRSIVVTDFNNDQRLDIAVINNFGSNVGVLLGNGNGTFSNQTSYYVSPGSAPYSVAVGDLNNDNYQDIVITIYYTRAINIYLGCGNGTFVSGATYSTGSASRPVSVAIADFNNDNQLDIVVANCKSDNIVIFIGNGDGSFANARTYSTSNNSCPTSVAFGDFNNDKILDVVVADYTINVVGVFIGFTYINSVRENIYSTGSSAHPEALALGDFNNDAQLDIIIAVYGLDNVGVLLGQTTGSFPSEKMFSTGVLSFPTSVAAGDLNNDSVLDIVVANSGTDNIGILYGYRNGSFASIEIYPIQSGSIPQSVAIGDFNNDKKLDIAVANSGTDSVLILLKYDIGAFRISSSYSTGTDSTPRWISVGDFNIDGWLDFVVVNPGYDNIGVFLALGDGNFSNQTTYSTGVGSNPWSTFVVDLNNDSYLDIIVSNSWSDNVGIFLGFGNGMFSNQTTYAISSNSEARAIIVVDLNNDNRLDIVIPLEYTFQIGIFYGYGNGTFSSVITYSTGSGSYPGSVVVADFNNDNLMDIVVANYATDSIGIFYGYKNNTFANMITYSTGSNSHPQSLVINDFNKDGKVDIAVTNSGTDNVGVFFGNNDGTFSDQMLLSTGSGSSPHGIVVGDFNNDNQLDIAVANYGSNTLGILLGCINGTFFSQLTYPTGNYSQPFSLAVGDFNNDRRLDIITPNSGTDNIGLFFGYINEDFLNAPVYSTGLSSAPNSITVADFNNDTRLDIVVANYDTDNVMILFGSGFGTFISHTTYSTGNGSQPCWVDVGDFNEDNRLDIVVANSGTNNIGVFLSNSVGTFSSQMTYFTGVRSQPYSVAILNFDGDTRLDIAVANYGANSLGVFLGYGNGSFVSQLIFATGFNSRPFALAIGDVNNDNLTDIVATNNGYGNIDILMKTC